MDQDYWEDIGNGMWMFIGCGPVTTWLEISQEQAQAMIGFRQNGHYPIVRYLPHNGQAVVQLYENYEEWYLAV